MLRLSLHRLESRLGLLTCSPGTSAKTTTMTTYQQAAAAALHHTRRPTRRGLLVTAKNYRDLDDNINNNIGIRTVIASNYHTQIYITSNNNNNNNMTISRSSNTNIRHTGTSSGNYAPTSSAHAVSHIGHNPMSSNTVIQLSEELPSLPVPSLEQTMDKLKESIAPFAMNSLELAETLSLIDEFQASAGQKLHLLLNDKAKQTKNWMSHDWWPQETYLRCRQPLMIDSNPGLIYPKFPPVNGGQRTINEFVARLVSAYMDCRDAIRQGVNLESLSSSSRPSLEPICFDQYSKIFGTTRIPNQHLDRINIKNVNRTLETFKIIIAHRNRFYELDLSDVTNNDSSTSIQQRLDTIKNALEMIENNSLGNAAHDEGQTNRGVGTLTCLPRDDWANVYSLLDNEALEAIDEAQFVLCLDTIKDDYRIQSFLDDSTHQRELGKQVLHADNDNIGNRWFDKTLQLIVVTDDKMENLLGAGINYEHTVAEATAFSRMIEYTFDKVVNSSESLRATSSSSSSDHDTMTQSLDLNTGSTIRQLSMFDKSNTSNLDIKLDEAKLHYQIMTHQLDLEVLNFTDYGKRAIKSWQFSPDSWIQLALSLSYYNLHGRLGPSYESASLRKFAYGRTETIRSMAQEVGQFCMNPTHDSLEQAIRAHNHLAKAASNGQGIDRVLMGYRLTFNDVRSGQWKWDLCLNNTDSIRSLDSATTNSNSTTISLDDLFNDDDISVISSFMNNELIQRSKRFVLSTSQVNSIYPNTFLTYGPLVPEGYGCCYNPTSDQIVVAITANSNNPSMVCSASKYKATLEESLMQMRNLVNQTYISKSKL